MPSLIGNKPNQVPSNGDLGTLAFQDASNVLVGNVNATGVTTVQAGTVSAPAITTTGDTNTGIYFPAADTIAFTEGGVESMRIDSSGNVGIGTSSPAAKLDVRTAAGTSAQMNLYSGSNATVTKFSIGQIAAIDWDIGLTATTGNFLIGGLGGSMPEAYRINRTGASVDYHAWNTAGTERMRIDSSGNVGIGVSSVTANTRLEVAATVAANANGVINVKDTTSFASGVGGRLYFSGQYNSSNAYAEFAAIQGVKENATSGNFAGALSLQVRANGAGAYTEGMRIDSAGNVGIGTSSPYSQLDVYSTIASPTTGEATGVGSIRITNGASALSSAGGLEFKIAGDANGYGAKIQTISSGGAQLVFANRNASATWTERMRITSTGNVGIGTSSPQARLQSFTSSDGSQAIFTGSQSTTEQTLLFRNQYYTNNTTAGVAAIGWVDSGSSGGNLTFKTGVNGGGTTNIPTEKMRIDNAGNVGIGTSSPASKLGIVVAPAAGGSSGISVGDGTRSLLMQITGSTYSYNGVGASENLIYAGGNPLSFLADGQPIKFCAGSAERMRIDSSGNVRVGTAALATTATNGFLYIPTCAGAPTGTPTAITGLAPMVIDSTNNKLYIYSGGAWVALN